MMVKTPLTESELLQVKTCFLHMRKQRCRSISCMVPVDDLHMKKVCHYVLSLENDIKTNHK